MWQSQCSLTQFVIALFFSAPAGLKAEVASIYGKVFNSLFFIFFQLSEWKKKGVISILTIKFSLEWSLLTLSSLFILSLTHNNQGFVLTITLTFLFWSFLLLDSSSLLILTDLQQLGHHSHSHMVSLVCTKFIVSQERSIL